MNLFSAVLRDVKVYSTGSRIKGTHNVCTIYRDRQRVFFEGYVPSESVRRFSSIEDADINRLLAPNSIEQRDAPLPPETPEEMYERLIALLRLEKIKGRPMGAKKVSVSTNEMKEPEVSAPAAEQNDEDSGDNKETMVRFPGVARSKCLSSTVNFLFFLFQQGLMLKHLPHFLYRAMVRSQLKWSMLGHQSRWSFEDP